MSTTPAPTASSTIGLKGVVIAELLSDTESGVSYGDPQAVEGAVEASVTPGAADPDVQYADDGEYDVLYPDPEISFKLKMVDLPLAIQKKIQGNSFDENGVLIRNTDDKPPYYAVGFKSEKSNHTYRFVWMFKCRAKPVTETYTTKEGTTITRQTGEVEFTAIKRTYDGNYQAIADEGENGFSAASAATFLSTVYTPVMPAIISDLRIGSLTLTPAFDSSVTSYTATATNDSDVINVAAPAGVDIEIKLGSAEKENGSALTWASGSNTVTVKATSGEATKTYTVTVTKSA